MMQFSGNLATSFQMMGMVHLSVDVGFSQDTGDANAWLEAQKGKKIRVTLKALEVE